MESKSKETNSVLMICYFFPPLQSSGVQRSLGFSTNLDCYGWNPIVLTVKDSKDPWVGKDGTSPPKEIRVETSYEFGLAKLADFLHGGCSRLLRIFLNKDLQTNYFRRLLCIPDPQICWFTTFKAFLLRKNYKIIYVTCSPFSSAISGCLLKYLTGKPLVLDFRDPWPESISMKNSSIIRSIHLQIEKYCVRICNKLILNTPGSLNLYTERYPNLSSKFICIPNGFDKVVKIKPSVSMPKDKLKIMHLGTFYGKRTPKNILEALMLLGDRNIEFIQVGDYHEDFNIYKERINFTHIPLCSHEESLQHMKAADVLYIKQGFSDIQQENTAIAAKTYEYLTTGIPILCNAPEGDNAKIIREYASVSRVVTSNCVEDLANAIKEIRDTLPQISANPKAEYLDRFNRLALTKVLAQTFNELI